MKSTTVLIDRHPGRSAQSIGVARALGTDPDLIHEPSVGVVGTKGDSQCYLGVMAKVDAIHERLKHRVGQGQGQLNMRLVQPEYTIATSDGIRNGTRESDFPHRHFFALQHLIDTELPARAEIAATLESAGFARVTHQVVRQTIAPDWPSFVEKSALRDDSFLARLSDNEFYACINALQAYADRIDASAPVTEQIDWFVFTRHGSQDASGPAGP